MDTLATPPYLFIRKHQILAVEIEGVTVMVGPGSTTTFCVIVELIQAPLLAVIVYGPVIVGFKVTKFPTTVFPGAVQVY